MNGFNTDGIYYLYKPASYGFKARCIMTNGTEWMVIQHRTGDVVAFSNRTIYDYFNGFGNIHEDHWLGLRKIRSLIDSGYKLKVKMHADSDRCVPGNDDLHFVGTWNFEIGTEEDGYRLQASPALEFGNWTRDWADIFENTNEKFRVKGNTTVDCMNRLDAG
jgi:hypothetical protein